MRYVPLFWRLFVPNAVVLLAAGIVLWVQPANGRIVALLGGFVVLLVVNLVLMRRAFAPLVRLTEAMRTTDPLRPGRRLSVTGPESEVTVLGGAFNEMLDRLERERRESGRRALAAQEAERRRLAGELHDEIGQNLTALGMHLGHAGASAPPGLRDDIATARQLTLDTVDQVRRLARQLRPEALDDLGLVAALATLCERVAEHTELRIDTDLRPELPPVSPEAELVVYRVAQESLTNAVRHAGASRATVSLAPAGGGLELRVSDDGVGLPAGATASSGGLRFMRERVVDIGASVRFEQRDGSGTDVLLTVPAGA